MTAFSIQKTDGGVVFSVKILAGSNKTAVCGLLGGMLKVKISAAPEKGKANRCLVEFLAGQLGVRKNAVNIISGQSSPVKKVQVLGISAEIVLKKLGLSK